MNRTEQIDLIRGKCIEALSADGTRSEQSLYARGFDRPIRLSDVLLAIQESGNGKAISYFLVADGNWNLRKDSLDEQTNETISFLADLLK